MEDLPGVADVLAADNRTAFQARATGGAVSRPSGTASYGSTTSTEVAGPLVICPFHRSPTSWRITRTWSPATGPTSWTPPPGQRIVMRSTLSESPSPKVNRSPLEEA